MKRQIQLLLILTLFHCVSHAQMSLMSDAGLPGKPLMVNKTVKYSGTPYLFTEWVSAKIVLKNESKYENVKIRYDVMDDLVEFEREGAVFLLDPPTAREFSFRKNPGNEEFVFKNGFNLPNYSKSNYFEIISDGKVKVLKKYTKQIINDPAATYGSTLNQTLENQVVLIVILPDSSSQIFKSTKKSIVGLFPEKKNEIEAYIKEKNPDLKDKTQLRSLFQYIDSIL